MPQKRESYTLFSRKGVWHFWYFDKDGHRRSHFKRETSKTAAIETARQFLKPQEGDMIVTDRSPPSPNHVLEWVPPSPHKGYYLEWVEPPPIPRAISWFGRRFNKRLPLLNLRLTGLLAKDPKR